MNEGLASFEEHEALELLLFFALPRRDTNVLAHELLKKFGSLQAVFNADPADLARVEGIGENAATLIKLQPELARKYWLDDIAGGTQISSIESAIEYVRHLLRGKNQEELYLLCLDAHFRIRHTEQLSRGTATQTVVSIRRIVESVVRTGTEKIILAHNHPGGACLPSKMDFETTTKILSAMGAVGISFLDHIIIGTDGAFSFSEKLLTRQDFTSEQARAAQYSGSVMQQLPSLSFL